MEAQRRRRRLLQLLGDQGRIEVRAAAGLLGVSGATVRRDLDALARQELLVRTHGGAVAPGPAYDLPVRLRPARSGGATARIAAAAAALVPTGAVVGLNGGTTTAEVARELASRQELAESGGVALTVVTNAVDIAGELAVRPYLKTVVTGGVVRANSYELTGPSAAASLELVSLDVAVLGVDAVHPAFGAATHDEGEAAANRAMTRRAERVVVIAAAAKLGRRAYAQICPTEEIDILVTEAGAPEATVRAFTARGVDVRLA